jgi:hypothetical protein
MNAHTTPSTDTAANESGTHVYHTLRSTLLLLQVRLLLWRQRSALLLHVT